MWKILQKNGLGLGGYYFFSCYCFLFFILFVFLFCFLLFLLAFVFVVAVVCLFVYLFVCLFVCLFVFPSWFLFLASIFWYFYEEINVIKNRMLLKKKKIYTHIHTKKNISKRRTPPISGQFFFAPTVSANWREYCSSLLSDSISVT